MKLFRTRRYAVILGSLCCIGLILRIYVHLGFAGSSLSIPEQRSPTQPPPGSMGTGASGLSDDGAQHAEPVTAYIDSHTPLSLGPSRADSSDGSLVISTEDGSPKDGKVANSWQEEDVLKSLMNLNGPQSNLGRLNGGSKGEIKDKAIVVGVGSEADVTWLHELSDDWDPYIYRPYDADAPLTVPANKGREAMVYLTYIIDHWQNLPSKILFHHGSRTSWHQAVDIVTLLRDLRLDAVEEIGYVSLRCTWRSGCPNEIRPLDRDTESDDLSRQAVEDWMPQVWGELFPNVTVPATIASQCCAQFIVTRKAIQSRSLDDYKRWREWLMTTDLPDDFSGRMFEKVWAYIFGMAAVHSAPAIISASAELTLCVDMTECSANTPGHALPWMIPKGRGWFLLDTRGRHLLKLAVIAFVCLLLGYTVRNLYSAEQQLSSHSFSLPGGISLGSWTSPFGNQKPDTPLNSDDSLNNATTSSMNVTLEEGQSTPSEAEEIHILPTEELIPPDRPFLGEQATIGKVTILFGGDNPTYERALRTHDVHNRIHGYPMNVLRQGILTDVWTKPAYILSLLLRELSKPKGQRLEWLFWCDADTVLINPNLPISLFLPPSPAFDHIHILVTNDFNGLNNGVFPVRVHSWSAELFAAVVAFRIYKPNFQMRFRDQTALEELLKEPHFKDNVVHLPQRWFNAYRGGGLSETTQPYQSRRGDLLVHFAGTPDRDGVMGEWMDLAEMHQPEWEIDLVHSSYPGEVKEYWAERSREVEALRQKIANATEGAQKLIQHTTKCLVLYGGQLGEGEKDVLEGKKKALESVLVGNKRENLEAIQKALSDLHGVSTNLLKHFRHSLTWSDQVSNNLELVAEKARKALLKHAHDTIFDAERSVMDVQSPAHLAAVENVEKKSTRLRELVVAGQVEDTEAIQAAIVELQQASSELLKKVHEDEDREASIISEIAKISSEGSGLANDGAGGDNLGSQELKKVHKPEDKSSGSAGWAHSNPWGGKSSAGIKDDS
ncbi:MAG: hypothetical protein M1812_000100 [Candelaria pacifica]|nr:MAG: hypothetical protein M1812_000100 [Candelaria pacifica]